MKSLGHSAQQRIYASLSVGHFGLCHIFTCAIITVKTSYVRIHEVLNQDKLLEELKSILKPNGKIYIIEPKFHVSKKSFEVMIDKIKSVGFEMIESPKVFFSRTVLLTNNK